MSKATIRTQMSSAILAMSTEDRMVADAHIATAVTRLPAWADASTLFAYVAMDDEVDLTAILNAALRDGKRVALPRIVAAADMEFCVLSPGASRTWSDAVATLVRHPFGFLQPADDADPATPAAGDIMIVPARAFDRRGFRVGRGGGYYDRALATLPAAVHTVGVGYAVQATAGVPADDTDRAVQVVVTDTETVFCRRV